MTRPISDKRICTSENRLSLVAANASLKDPNYVAVIREKVISERDAWHDLFRTLNFRFADSHGNFVFFNSGRPHQAVATALAAQGIVTARALSRRASHRRRWTSAIRARPACVLGPVDLPPWKRQRALPDSALTWQQPPARVLAPQRSPPLRRLSAPDRLLRRHDPYPCRSSKPCHCRQN
jgi:hypothetical protein